MHALHTTSKVGIDDMSIYVPSLFLPIADLAVSRGIEPARLERGLGLRAMAVPDTSEDVVTMAAEALVDLVEKNAIPPSAIGRIYVGTESMIDGSKPIASYLLGILEAYYKTKGIKACELRHCDCVDLTFACIGAVDAMENCLDWVRLNPDKKAIVVSTDWAKYELRSPGESTQGAGALAMLLSSNPRLLEVSAMRGVSCQSEHDFFKPIRRAVERTDVISPNGVPGYRLGKRIRLEHSEMPVYDGRFSNQCYADRIKEAFDDWKEHANSTDHPFDSWKKMVFHLPYAYHARRVFTPLYVNYLQETGKWSSFLEKHKEEISTGSTPAEYLKAISKTASYKSFVKEFISGGEVASSLIGNLYTGSVFASIISCLATEERDSLSNESIGLFAYGSGSKSKVFEARVVEGYQALVDRIDLFRRLASRKSVSFSEYEYLHQGKLMYNLDSIDRSVFHVSSGATETNRYARDYELL